MDIDAVLARLDTIFRGISTPSFTVQQSEPLALTVDGSPWLCYWYTGEEDPPEGTATFGNVMFYEKINVECFWKRVAERSALPVIEAEIWKANRALKTALRGDSTLNGLVKDMDITNSTINYGRFPDVSNLEYRRLAFEVWLKELEGEAITP